MVSGLDAVEHENNDGCFTLLWIMYQVRADLPLAAQMWMNQVEPHPRQLATGIATSFVWEFLPRLERVAKKMDPLHRYIISE
jgi:NAD/NADP transhydrogenase alpha subunit